MIIACPIQLQVSHNGRSLVSHEAYSCEQLSREGLTLYRALKTGCRQTARSVVGRLGDASQGAGEQLLVVKTEGYVVGKSIHKSAS